MLHTSLWSSRKCGKTFMSPKAMTVALLLLSAELIQLSTTTSLVTLRPEARLPSTVPLEAMSTQSVATNQTPIESSTISIDELLLKRIGVVSELCTSQSPVEESSGWNSSTVKSSVHNRMITFDSESIRRPLIENGLIGKVALCVDLLGRLYNAVTADTTQSASVTPLRSALQIETSIHRLTLGMIVPDDNEQIRIIQCQQHSHTKGPPTSSNNDLRGDNNDPFTAAEQCHINEYSTTQIFATNNVHRRTADEDDVFHYIRNRHTDRFIRALTSGRLYIDSPSSSSSLPTKSQLSINNQWHELSALLYDCNHKLWIVSYSTLLLERIPESDSDQPAGSWYKVTGFLTADIDVSHSDIDQCDANTPVDDDSNVIQYDHNDNSINPHHTPPIIFRLKSTHKCHRQNSFCKFLPGKGIRRGAYACHCRNGFYSPTGAPFNGSIVEQSFHDKSVAYDAELQCRPCSAGCTVCVDESPCLSNYNWPFRIALLSVSILCIVFCMILAINIHRYRKVKVIRVASPVFLTITLLGCALMYSETVFIFPVVSTGSCVMMKWSRHFGFACTYSALLLKTWRVSLTYRVKSAHKIKLTDKQLLHWLFPILLVMAIYLGAWTISDPPKAIDVHDWNGLKFKFCEYNWWDHSIVIGELVFLLWGIKVCYNVRNAESVFNEAKYISCAIYNITLVNTVMILLHLGILPDSGPDLKYFFGFVRIQLSTSITVALIFGPKFYRVIRGRTDLFDSRRRGVAESFSFNGVSAHEETTDLYQENDELKQEIQKIAAQMEILKICQMQFRNRHLKFSRAPLQHHQQTQTSSSPGLD